MSIMTGNGENIEALLTDLSLIQNKRHRRMELSKQGSAGSTDSEDLSEDSCTSNSSWTGDGESNNESLESTSQLLIANMDPSIFSDREVMEVFENMIRKYDTNAKFFYFKSFSRVRVDMDSVATASLAKAELNGRTFGTRTLKCYFFRDLLLGRRNSGRLELPAKDKQFLISPPASPPVGWEPVHEGEPIIDYNLLAALASLQPGESHELHPGAEDKNIPSIVLLPCNDDDEEVARNVTSSSDLEDDSDDDQRRSKQAKVPIAQTRRPPMPV